MSPKSAVTNIVSPEASLKAELEALRAENARLKAQQSGRLSVGVGKSGTIVLRGHRRQGTALYPAEWDMILGNAKPETLGEGGKLVKTFLDNAKKAPNHEYEVKEYNDEGKETGNTIKVKLSWSKADK